MSIPAPKALLFTVITPALILSALHITFVVAFSALIFSNELNIYLTQGIGVLLFGALVSTLILALFSSYKGSIGSAQDVPATLTVVMSSNVLAAHALNQNSETTFYTILAVLACSTLITSIMMLSLGAMKMGKLIRFIPFPVIGGLLAGAGWLLLVVSLHMMTGLDLNIENLPDIFSVPSIIRWLPGLAIAAILLWVDVRFSNPLSIPATILLCFAGFHIMLFLLGQTADDALNNGLLLSLSNEKPPFGISFFDVYHMADWPTELQMQ